MGYYGVFLDLENRRALVVGGGEPARLKAATLAEAGAEVTVVADSFCAPLAEMGRRGEVTLCQRSFEESDLEAVAVVIDASLDPQLGPRVSAAARRHRVLVNVLDKPALCDFIAPALVRRGPVQVAISTSGRSPYMASRLRRQLETVVTPAHGHLVELVGELRDRLRASAVPLARQEEVYAQVPGCGALELLEAGDIVGARRAVEGCAGTQLTDPE